MKMTETTERVEELCNDKDILCAIARAEIIYVHTDFAYAAKITRAEAEILVLHKGHRGPISANFYANSRDLFIGKP